MRHYPVDKTEKVDEPVPVEILKKKKGVHYRKEAHGRYVVWIDGIRHLYDNNRHAKKFFIAEKIKKTKNLHKENVQ